MMRRVAIALAFFAACMSAGSALAAVSHLPADVRASLARSGEFWRFVGVAAIPDEVRAAFAQETGEAFAMAEPGAEWQGTDALAAEALPRRRLEMVALSKTHCFLFYELAGSVRARLVTVFRLDEGNAALVWRAIQDGSVRHPAHILRRIDAGAFDDDPKHGF